MQKYLTAIEQTLLPAAQGVLTDMYRKYCAGDDIGIEQKSDTTPASMADRKAEETLRTIITDLFPNDGLWGEEFGGYNTGASTIWVLDPLDGTREFLAKKPHHFGTLIGVLRDGRAICGGIGDPFAGIRHSGASRNPQGVSMDTGFRRYDTKIVACTAPIGMFGQETALRIFDGFEVRDHLNCIGFAQVADGSMDAAIERDLALHDIAALIPVLAASGAMVCDLDGNDYTNRVFDLDVDTQRKFTFVTARDRALVDTLIERARA